MATKRKQHLKTKPAAPLAPLAEDEKDYLLAGPLLDGTFRGDPEIAKQAWVRHRTALMTEWFSDKSRWGTRPSGFWEYDRPFGVVRKQLLGLPPLPDSAIHWGQAGWWPMSEHLCESEFSCLARHNLLTPEELAAFDELQTKYDGVTAQALDALVSLPRLARYKNDERFVGRDLLRVPEEE